MIIRTHVDISTLISASKAEKTKNNAVVKEEEVIPKKKKYKKPTVVVEETPIVVEDVKIEEEIDLSEWLKDDINE